MNRNIDFTVGPYQLALDITNKCNLRCLHCYNASGENRVMEHELSDDEVIKFVKDILPMKLLNFCFCGGETLLSQDSNSNQWHFGIRKCYTRFISFGIE